MPSKSIFTSKTFWLNLLSAAAMFTGYLPPKYAAVAIPALNIGNRFLTDGPVHVISGGN